MKKATKFIVGGVVVVTALVGIRAFAGNGGMGCHSEGMRSSMVERMVSRVSSELALTTEQQGKLDELVATVKAKREMLKSGKEQHKQDILSLLDGASLDQTQAQSLLQGKTQMIEQQAPEVIAALAGFTDSLSAEQRADLKERIESRMNHRGRSHRFGMGDK